MAGVPSSRQAEAASLRRHAHAEELYEKIHGYHMKNVDVASIARHVGVSRQTVYRYLEMIEPPEPTQISIPGKSSSSHTRHT
jgi:predicted transcriptional regulator YheO